MIVSYESIRRGLDINAKVVINTIVEKTQTSRFFILYNNINVYEYARNQRIHNWRALLNYIAGYICFIKTPESMDDSNDTWAEWYIDHDQIDRKLVNKLSSDKFEPDKNNEHHRSAVVRYTISEVLGQFFSVAIKQ